MEFVFLSNGLHSRRCDLLVDKDVVVSEPFSVANIIYVAPIFASRFPTALACGSAYAS